MAQRIPLAMPATVLTSFSRWVLEMWQANGRAYMEKYLEWHSRAINPKEQIVSPGFFDAISKDLALRHNFETQLFLVLAWQRACAWTRERL